MLEGLLWRHRLARAHHRDRDTERSPLVYTPLEFTINLVIDPVDLKAG